MTEMIDGLLMGLGLAGYAMAWYCDFRVRRLEIEVKALRRELSK